MSAFRLPCAPVACIAVVLVASAAAGDVTYTPLGSGAGLAPLVEPIGLGSGIAAADFDDDGLVDLFVPCGFGTPDRLLRNLGDGTFEDVAVARGVASLENHRTAAWLDVDGDGRLDLMVGGDGFANPGAWSPTDPVRLFLQNRDGTFTDATAAWGITPIPQPADQTHMASITAADLDGDGDLDVFISQWRGEDRLLRNDGNAFTDVTAASGITIDDETAWQSVMHDFDGDGLVDIFAAVDFQPNRLWRNLGDLTFEDVATSAGVDTDYNEMGVTLGDYDGDGDFDVYATNISEPGVPTGKHSVLFRNDSTPGVFAFTELAIPLGVADAWWGWGCTWLDADRDGLLDLAVTNGYFLPPWDDDPSRLFLGDGGSGFVDVGPTAGFDDTAWGAALVAVDLDRDFDLDLVQTRNQGGGLAVLLAEPAVERGALVVRPRMPDSLNTRAIGAEVRVTAGGSTQIRRIATGTSFLGQEPAEAFFGLGDATSIDCVTIVWPDGRRSVLTDVAPDQVLDAAPTCVGDIDLDGTVGLTDLLAVLGGWGPCDACCRADLDADGVVGFGDLLFVISTWDPC